VLTARPQSVSLGRPVGALYLDRCQVDTPSEIVTAVWDLVRRLRPTGVGKVVDFGAGDGRFARTGAYEAYEGYEIDCSRSVGARLPDRAQIFHSCAFEQEVSGADLCIGNPPYVRNQDLPLGWAAEVAQRIKRRLGVEVSGLANAWQYFFLWSLASTKNDGLCALVMPREWISRPSCRTTRQYLRSEGYDVDVYDLPDDSFPGVLTTASITIVDKATRTGSWRYHLDIGTAERYQESPTGNALGVIPYRRRIAGPSEKPRFMRGLSPGTQRGLVLTEDSRVANDLDVERDVVACVPSLRTLPEHVGVLDQQAFKRHWRDAGRRCWLVRSDVTPSVELARYLASVDPSVYATATCRSRSEWWRFAMPPIPEAIVAQGFKGARPKAALNAIGARAVGGVCGLHRVTPAEAARVVTALKSVDFVSRIVAHASSFNKLEIGQLNHVLPELLARGLSVANSDAPNMGF
jgi:hypothetical protein